MELICVYVWNFYLTDK